VASECHVKHLLLRHISVLPFFSIVMNVDIDCQHMCSIWLCRLCACACWWLMVDLQITGKLLIGMGKKAEPCRALLLHFGT